MITGIEVITDEPCEACGGKEKETLEVARKRGRDHVVVCEICCGHGRSKAHRLDRRVAKGHCLKPSWQSLTLIALIVAGTVALGWAPRAPAVAGSVILSLLAYLTQGPVRRSTGYSLFPPKENAATSPTIAPPTEPLPLSRRTDE